MAAFSEKVLRGSDLGRLIYPSRFVIMSPLSPEQALAALVAVTVPDQFEDADGRPYFPPDTALFEGEIEGNGFNFRPVREDWNPFSRSPSRNANRPHCRGRIMSANGGSEIEIRMRAPRLPGVMFGLVLAVMMVIIFIATLAGGHSEGPHSNGSGDAGLVVFTSLLGGAVLLFNRYFYWQVARRTRRQLAQVLQLSRP